MTKVLVDESRVYLHSGLMNIICADCGGVKSNSKTSLYCRPCGLKRRKRPSGLKYNITKDNPTSFKKGAVPWNKGKIGVMPRAWNKGTKGLTKRNSGSFSTELTSDEKNKNWRGDDVGYHALHGWVNRKLGKATICSNCGQREGRIEWANKSHQYKRDLSDWISLCKKCHARYDKDAWGHATKLYPAIGHKRV